MRLLLPLLSLAAAACGAFEGTATTKPETTDDNQTATPDSGVLAEAHVHTNDGGVFEDPCAAPHLYCNNFELEPLENGFVGQNKLDVKPTGTGAPTAGIVESPPGGHAARFSLGDVANDETRKYRIGQYLKGAPADGRLRVSFDIKLAITSWPADASLALFVITLPSGDAGDSGQLTLGIDSSRKPTLSRQLSTAPGSPGAPLESNSAVPLALDEWLHVAITLDTKINVTVTRANGTSSTPVDADHGIQINGGPPTAIVGPAHYPYQGALPAFDVLYDNLIVDALQ